jgi:hypothetical protein
MPPYTKKIITAHIVNLFNTRPNAPRPTRWACVIKRGRLTVVKRHYIMPSEIVIIERLLKPGESPSSLAIYLSVWKKWAKLKNVETEQKSNVQS